MSNLDEILIWCGIAGTLCCVWGVYAMSTL